MVYERIMIWTLPAMSTKMQPSLVGGRGTRKYLLTSCLINDEHQIRPSSRRQKRARKAGTDQTAYMCLASYIRVTILQDEGYWRFQIEVELIVAYRCSKLNAYCLLNCRDYSTLNCFLCQATMTLHQGQGHRHEHEYWVLSEGQCRRTENRLYVV